ncbi:MAG: sialate O-acetylesterase [Candidatus Cyclobacteriaceae bacterium M3_2C_046]
MDFKSTFLITFFSLFSFLAHSEIRLPQVIGDQMVLQRNQVVPLWGWADVRERIKVSFNGQELKTRADREGKWRVELEPMSAGGPYNLIISGKNTITLSDILIGDVWVASGQSNMEWPMSRVDGAEEAIARASYPKIRLFTVPRSVSKDPKADIEQREWQETTPGTIQSFSAVAYFFGKHLQQHLDIPIGLIHTSWGGTEVEAWTSTQAINSVEDFKQEMEELENMDLMQRKQEMEMALQKYMPDPDDLPYLGGTAVWSGTEYDDSGWATMEIPGLWEASKLPGLNGVVWFRKEVDIPKEIADQEFILHLGPIDDQDITWVNGIKVGETNQYDQVRNYQTERGVFKPGKNVITIRVNDTGGGGGIWGQPDQIYLQARDVKQDLSGPWKFRVSEADVNSAISPNEYPTMLFNAMINPLIPFAIKGVIWYQGEANASRANQYRKLFPLMITDWRNHWQQGDFPFLFVQLANFIPQPTQPGQTSWAELREAQTKTLALPNTAMAVTIDIGNPDDIHPTNKQDVGHRLALAARKIAYGEDLVYSGPQYNRMEIDGDQVTITFDHVGSGLKAKSKYGYVRGFQLAGKDQQFHWAKAELTGDSQVKVYAAEVNDPTAVRYNWGDSPDGNLYNKEGLPAIPFRTDDWQNLISREK